MRLSIDICDNIRLGLNSKAWMGRKSGCPGLVSTDALPANSAIIPVEMYGMWCHPSTHLAILPASTPDIGGAKTVFHNSSDTYLKPNDHQ